MKYITKIYLAQRRKIKEQPLLLILYLAVLAAIAVNIILTIHHEPFRDEAQSWLIARDTGPITFFNVSSYEGHPFLWYYILMPFAHLGFPYRIIHVISVTFMSVVILLIAFRAPFMIPARIMLIFSCICIYWYASYGRSYCVYAFLVILLRCFFSRRHEKPWLYVVLISLVIQIHILTIGFAFGLCLAFLLEVWHDARGKALPLKKAVKGFVPLCLPLASALFLLWELRDVNRSHFIRRVDDSTVLKTISEYLKGGLRVINTFAGIWCIPLCICFFVAVAVFFRSRRSPFLKLLVFACAFAPLPWIIGFMQSPSPYRVLMLAN